MPIHWLDFANYGLPKRTSLIFNLFGFALLIIALWLFRRAHTDLGLNWSPYLKIRDRHSLITRGVYQYIRHPMYASRWFWCSAQAFLLQNWIAGLIGLFAFAPLYMIRVTREEQMMLKHFGEDYRLYMNQTGRIFPNI
jgi:protein-S-isoprenylcysteine O-methyltransferase Ste14